MATNRTLEEATTYLSETIDKWTKDESKQHKVLALAGFAKRWNNTGGGTVAKIKNIKKNLRSLEIILDRNKRCGFATDLYENEITRLKSWIEKTEVTLPPKSDKK